jgi:predicted XRE-type DNA-binding protein
MNNEIYTHEQAKMATFAKNPEVKSLYDEMEAEYHLKSQLIEARIAKGLSQKQLAEMIETQQSAISRWEKEDCFQMSIKQLTKMAYALDKKVEIRLV